METFDKLIDMYRKAGEEFGVPFGELIISTEGCYSPSSRSCFVEYTSLPKEDNVKRHLLLECEFVSESSSFRSKGFATPTPANAKLIYTGDFNLWFATNNPEFGELQLNRKGDIIFVPPRNRTAEVFYDWFDSEFSITARTCTYDLLRAFVKLYAHGTEDYSKHFLLAKK